MATTVEIDTIINTDRSEAGLRELNKSLKQLISLQSQVAEGSDQFKRLQNAINDTEGKIGDLNDSFQTLRGSGVERLNSSLGVLKDGFLSADPGKISTGFKGLSAAMSAIPIFLLIEGLSYLVQNFDAVVDVVKSVIGVVNEEAEAQKKLNKELQETSFTLNELGLSYKYFEAQRKQGLAIEIEQLNRRGAKQIEINELIIESEQKKLDKLKQLRDDATNLGVKDLTKYQNAVFEQEDQIRLLNEKNTTDKVKASKEAYEKQKELVEKQKAIYEKDATEFNRLLGLKQEYEDAVNAQRIADAQAQSDRETEIVKKQIEEQKALKQYNREQQSNQDQEADAKLEAKRRRDSENNLAYDNAFQQKTLNQKIDFIEQDRDTQLLNEDLTQKQRIAIIEKAENDIFQLKVKKGQEYVAYAQSASNVLNSLSAYRTQNENYEIQQQEYQKQASIQNDSIRTQQLIDQEELRKNVALNNANLTAEERERIAYDSETKQLAIANYSKDAQNKINADFAKKELEIKRQQFERNKKLQIVNGIINTAASVLQTLGSVPYPANIPLAILAGVAGAIQVATIANQKFDAGPTAIQTPQAIDTRGGLPSSSPNSPSPSQGSNRFNPTGNLVAGGQNNTTNSNGTIKVVVLESDIRDVTSKVNVLESRATFGD